MPEPTDSDSRQAPEPAFLEWRAGLPSFEMDGERFYLPTGDIPMDEVQIEELWARQHPPER